MIFDTKKQHEIVYNFSEKMTRFELSPNLNMRRGSHKEYDVTPATAPVPILSQPPPTEQQVSDSVQSLNIDIVHCKP